MEETVQTNNSQSVPPQAPSSSRNLITTIAIAVIVSIVSSLATYMFMSSKQNKQSQMSYQQTPTISPTQSVVSIPTQPVSAKSFVKRQFDVNKKIEISGGNFIDYPKEILNISENDLVGMKCSPYIWYGYNPAPDSYLYDDENVPTEKLTTKDIRTLTDERLLKLINEAKKTVADKIIGDVRFCDTEDNRVILQYGTPAGGGGSQSVANFGIVNSDGTVKQITAIPNDGAPYFECRQPLQLTKTNLLYYKCGGGDGLFGATSFYKINMTANTHSAVLKCTSVGSDTDEPAKITCI